MAFVGVEFPENGLIGLVHSSWFTPLKQNVLWPPYRTSAAFNRALTQCEEPDENNWKLSGVKRIFFECDDLNKAQKKLNKCEYNSDNLTSDCEGERIRKRFVIRRILSDSESEEETASHLIRPPSLQKFTSVTSSGKSASRPLVKPTSRPASARQEFPSQAPGGSYSQLTPTTSNIQSVENTDNINSKNLEKIFQELKKLREEVKEVKTLLKNSRSLVVASLPNDIPVQFPIDDQERFKILEEYLKSEEKFNDLASYLSSLGGNGTTAHVNRVMRLLMTNRLAKSYNFAGQRNDKVAFCNTLVKSVIIRAIQIKTPLTSQVEVENAIKIWLKHAKQREQKKNAGALVSLFFLINL